MRVRPYLLAAAALLAISLAAGLVLFSPAQLPEVDLIAANDLAYRLAGSFEAVEAHGADALPSAPGGVDYSVFGPDGSLLAATAPGLAPDINSAIRNRDTIIDITQDGEVLGKLVIASGAEQAYQAAHRRQVALFAALAILLTAITVLLLLQVNRQILKPFADLQAFAARIAAGNLDIPLSMDRQNTFGAFSESFDLMRSELALAREREAAATKAKQELVASLSHDIKTPVASIKALAELMLATSDADPAADQATASRLQTIGEKADQIDQLISNLFQATLEELEELPVRCQEIPSDIIADALNRIDYRHLLAPAELADAIPGCLVWADPLRLEQVLDNIIANSYKYADTPISVTARIDAQHLLLTIADSGPGVLPDELPLLTHKFFRGSNSVDKSGSGLGLYIADYLMEQMGGSLACTNTPDGFAVQLAFPLA